MEEATETKRIFSLAAFSQLKETELSNIPPESLYQSESPINVAVKDKSNNHQIVDDGAIKRVYKTTFTKDQYSTRTTPRRPFNQKYYYCPSNTIVASNGEIYHVEPFMMPPPQQISAMLKGLSSKASEAQDEISGGFSPKINSRSNIVSMPHPTGGYKSLDQDKIKKEIYTKSTDLAVNEVSRRRSASAAGNDDDEEEENEGVDKLKPLRSRSRLSDPGYFASPRKKLFTLESRRPRAITVSNNFKEVENPKHITPVTPRGGEEPFENFSLANYLQCEMLGFSEILQYESNAVYKIHNFVHVPFMVEKIINFGLFICLDAFLYVLTYLPIRVILAIFSFLYDAAASVCNNSHPENSSSTQSRRFTHTNRFDLIRGILILVGVSALRLLNMSRVYHYIRGQNVIKLYVLTAILEVFDKLFGSFGQDVFESLHLQVKDFIIKRENLITYLVITIYVVIHSTIYFLYTATLLVAINSAEQALITVLFLNNFAEIKSFVFKKFDRISLFQLTCGDVTERFQLILFLFLIMTVSVAQSGDSWKSVLRMQVFVFCVMVTGESIADWIKHAFIAKFNSLDSTMYEDMARVLRRDIINISSKKTVVDHNYALIRRVGLSQIPLGCVTIRYLILALESPCIRNYLSSLSYSLLGTQFAILFTILVAMKVATGVTLILFAGYWHNLDLNARKANFDQTSIDKLKEQRELMIQLSNIERYTLYRGKVHG